MSGAMVVGGSGEDMDVDVELTHAPAAPAPLLPSPPQPPAPFNSFNGQCLSNIKQSQVPFFERFYCRFNTFLKVDNPLKGGEKISLEVGWCKLQLVLKVSGLCA